MQSGREDNLEVRYAIKFCVKLGKNARETYEMLQTAYGLTCMCRSSVFRWHKRFKDGREEVRDDERCGREKDVRTSELVEKIRSFLDEDSRVSIKTISIQFGVGVATVHRIIHEDLNMRKICAKFVPSMLSDEQKERRVGDSREMVELITSNPRVLTSLVTCDECWIYCYDPETEEQSAQSNLGSPTPKKAKQSKYTGKLMMIPFFDSKGIIYTHWVPSGQSVTKEYFVEVLKEFGERFPYKRPELHQSGQWHLHQDNTPVHNSILVTSYLTEMGIKTVLQPPYSPDLSPCDFWLFPKLKEKLKGRRFDDIEKIKEAVTKVLDTFTLEDFHGAFMKWLERYNKCIEMNGSYFEGE